MMKGVSYGLASGDAARLAYHNGLTVTCKSFDSSDGTKLGVTDPSVVNGGQSVVALFAAAALGNLTDDLRLTVKFVEVEGRPQLAWVEVAAG